LPAIKRSPIVLTIIVGCLFLSTDSYCKEVVKTKMNNGLTVLTKEVKHNDIVAVVVALRAGLRFEEENQSGITALAKEMVRKGTATRSAVEIAEALDRIGVRLSTGADDDQAVLTLSAMRDYWKQGVEILLDLLRNATFPEDALERTRQIQLQHIKGQYDSPIQHVLLLFRDELYGTHPYHRSVLGTEETVSSLTREDLIQFYQKHYQPQNMIISVVGDVPRDEVLEVFQGAWPEVSGDVTGEVPIVAPSVAESRTRLEDKDTQAAWVIIGYPAAPMASPDYAPLKVMNSILGGSMASRLFRNIRDAHGLAYQIGSFYPSRMKTSFYAAYIGTAPGNLDRVKEAILAEFEKVQTEAVEPEELESAKTFISGQYIMGQESNASQASLAAWYEMTGLGYDFVDQYPEMINSVTADDVLRVARTYLTDYVMTGVRPPNEVPGGK